MMSLRQMVKLKRPLPSSFSAGFSLLEALVASFLLILAATQSLNLFAASMVALGKAQLRDGLNAAISADLEQVRTEVSSWASTATTDGQLAYAPAMTNCLSGTLGQQLLADKTSQLPITSNVDLSTGPTKLKGIQITRSISILADNKNLIRISYATAPGSPISITQSTTLNTPAQGWCS